MTCAPSRLSPMGPGPAPSAQAGALVPLLRGFRASIGRRDGDRVRKRSSAGTSRSLRNSRGTFGQRSRKTHSRRQVVHAEPPAKDFVPHIGSKLGPERVWLHRRFFVRLKGAVSPPWPTSCQAPRGATFNDRASDRDTAPKASLTVASTVLLQIGPLEASGKQAQVVT